MAFEAMPKAVFDSLHDPGIYYVYEKGQLHAPPGYSHHYDVEENSLALNERCFLEELTLDKASKCHNPPSLLHVCCDFVADRITLVDSFEGFPELIGETLFKRVMQKGLLDSPTEESIGVLKKFSEGYETLVCDKFVLRDSCIGLNICADALIQCFTTLTVLDLHGCRIGDDHDILKFISESLSLQKLGLSLNALSDRGLQKLTAPLRLFKRGPRLIEALNLSDNPDLTDGVIRSIVCFPKLCKLDLTRTQLTQAGIKRLETSTNLVVRRDLSNATTTTTAKPGTLSNAATTKSSILSNATTITKPCSHSNATTKPCILGNPQMEGWATPVLEKWIHDADPVIDKSADVITEKRKSSFYGSKRKRLTRIEQFHQDARRNEAEKLRNMNQVILIFESQTKCTEGSNRHGQPHQFALNQHKCNNSTKQNIDVSKDVTHCPFSESQQYKSSHKTETGGRDHTCTQESPNNRVVQTKKLPYTPGDEHLQALFAMYRSEDGDQFSNQDTTKRKRTIPTTGGESKKRAKLSDFKDLQPSTVDEPSRCESSQKRSLFGIQTSESHKSKQCGGKTNRCLTENRQMLNVDNTISAKRSSANENSILDDRDFKTGSLKTQNGGANRNKIVLRKNNSSENCNNTCHVQSKTHAKEKDSGRHGLVISKSKSPYCHVSNNLWALDRLKDKVPLSTLKQNCANRNQEASIKTNKISNKTDISTNDSGLRKRNQLNSLVQTHATGRTGIALETEISTGGLKGYSEDEQNIMMAYM